MNDVFIKHFYNEKLGRLGDSAILEINSKLAFTANSLTVKPIFFNGENIGKFAVAETVNDIYVMEVKHLYLSAGFIMYSRAFLSKSLKLLLRVLWMRPKRLEHS